MRVECALHPLAFTNPYTWYVHILLGHVSTFTSSRSSSINSRTDGCNARVRDRDGQLNRKEEKNIYVQLPWRTFQCCNIYSFEFGTKH